MPPQRNNAKFGAGPDLKNEFRFGEVTIGSNLAAVCFSAIKQLPIIMVSPFPELEVFFERFPIGTNLSAVGLKQNQELVLCHPEGKIYLGEKKINLWKKVCFFLSYSGLIPFPGTLNSVFLEGNNILLYFNDGTYSKGTFELAHVFDLHNVSGLIIKEQPKDNERPLKIIDVFSPEAKTSIGGKIQNDIEMLKFPDENFVKEIYLNNDITKIDIKKLAIIISYLSEEQLASSDFSESTLRIVAKGILKEHGCLDRRQVLKFLFRTIIDDKKIKIEESKNIISHLQESDEDVLNFAKPERYSDVIKLCQQIK